VYGVSTGNTPGGSAGVFGGAETAIGVEGYSGTTAAVHGFSSGAAGTGIGVYGFSTQHLGVLAESNNYIGLYAVSKTAFNPAVYGYSSFVGPGRTAGRFDGDVVVNGNFTVAGGAKAAAVTLPDGSVRMMYCQESPEPYFEDFGGGVVTGGTGRVNLEPAFASLVKLDGYRVFLTAEGDSRGLYVSAKDATGFDVSEQQGGQSNVGFSYRIVAKRKDIPGDRLAPVSPQAAKAIPVPATLPKVDIAPQQVPNITPAQPVTPSANGQPSTPPFGPANPKSR
jgi:hypothetical protein